MCLCVCVLSAAFALKGLTYGGCGWTGVQPGVSSPHANRLNWRTTNAARQDDTECYQSFFIILIIISLRLLLSFSFAVFWCHIYHTSQLFLMIRVNLITQQRESVWNLHLLIKPEITMATLGKSIFLCWAEKKTSLL